MSNNIQTGFPKNPKNSVIKFYQTSLMHWKNFLFLEYSPGVIPKGLWNGMELPSIECLTYARYFVYLFKFCNHFAVETRAYGA